MQMVLVLEKKMLLLEKGGREKQPKMSGYEEATLQLIVSPYNTKTRYS